jgi:hypothetical protein
MNASSLEQTWTKAATELMLAATILAARKLAQYDKPCPGIESAIANAVAMAEKIMRKIDALYPVKQNDAKAPYKY